MTNAKKLAAVFAVIFFCAAGDAAFSQTAEEMDGLLSAESVTYEQAAWFILRAVETPGISNPAAAFNYAASRRWLPAKAAPDSRAKLNGIALLIMQSGDLKGGLMYTLTKSPRYAYRELRYLNIIQGRTDPQMAVSGDMLFFMASLLLEARGGSDEE